MRALRIHCPLHEFAFLSVLLPFLPFAFLRCCRCLLLRYTSSDYPSCDFTAATAFSFDVAAALKRLFHGVSLPSSSMVESPSVAAGVAYRFCAAVNSFCSVAASSASLPCSVSLDSSTFSASFAAACLFMGIVSNSAYLLQLGVCLLCASTTSLETTLLLSSIWE